VENDLVRLVIAGTDDIGAESYGVEKKRDLFEETFGRLVTVEQELVPEDEATSLPPDVT
jgi:hypothetical protein